MPRELITIQVGQCGNQIGGRFWDMALREHAAINQKGIFDEAMSRSTVDTGGLYCMPVSPVQCLDLLFCSFFSNTDQSLRPAR